MATPICNCAADIGWLDEGAWPLSAGCKSTAQRIYCVGGNPVIPSRPQFVAAGEARIDYGNGVPQPGINPDPASSQATPIALAIPPTSINTFNFTNDTCYPLKMVLTVSLDVMVGITPGQSITYSPRLTLSNGLSFAAAGGAVISSTDGTGLMFRQYGYTVPVSGTLAPGAFVTLTPDIPAYFTSGSGSGFSGFSQISLAARIFGGAA